MICLRRPYMLADRAPRMGMLGMMYLMCACGSQDTLPFLTNPAVVVTLTPAVATVRVGDTTRFVAAISGGSSTAPPIVASCALAFPQMATVTASLAGCTVVGVSPGTTDVSVMVSTGQQDSARVVVVPRSPSSLNSRKDR